MVATVRKPLTAAVIGISAALACVSSAFAQGTLLPPSPVPTLPAPTDPVAPPTLGRPQPVPTPGLPTYPPTTMLPPAPPPGAIVYPPPGAIVYPPPPLTPPPAPRLPLYQPHDPGPNGWGPYAGPSADPEFILNAELQVLHPSLKNRLMHNVTLNDGTDVTVAPPGVSLSTTVSPELEIGYRLSESLGEFTLGYRFITSSGTSRLNDAPLNSSVKTRLNVNVLDFDYSTARYAPIPRWDMKWWLGVRYASVFFDNQQTNDFMNSRGSNYFNGAGPHAGLEVQRQIDPLPAFAVFGRIDGAVMIGPVRQKFTYTQIADGGPLEGTADERKTQSVPMINLRAGLSYVPPQFEHWRFSAGYQFEQWWSVGQLGDSRGELSSHGAFFRAELDF